MLEGRAWIRYFFVMGCLALGRMEEFLIVRASSAVFFILDLVDRLLCVVFWALDSILDSETTPCYCKHRIGGTFPPTQVPTLGKNALKCGSDSATNGSNPSSAKHVLGKEDDRPVSEEAIVFQELVPPIHDLSVDRGPSVRRIISRWSDCGCCTCTSWHSDEKELLYVHTEGAGHENVVFIHGFASSSAIWAENVIPYLPSKARASHRLFALDLLGFGKSPKPRSSLYTMSDHIKKIKESILHRHKIDSFHIVAHSMGCIIALALAAAHVDSVKTITLISPPYFQAPENESGASYVLRQLAPRRIWPPLAFGSSVMSWYEHVGRVSCFILCKQHFFWEWLVSILTLNRISRLAVCDFMQHTHHSAWHIFHNVICGEAHAMNAYLSILEKGSCKIQVIHGESDAVVPVHCSYQLQKYMPKLELKVLEGANHFNVIYGREKALALELGKIWEGQSIEGNRRQHTAPKFIHHQGVKVIEVEEDKKDELFGHPNHHDNLQGWQVSIC